MASDRAVEGVLYISYDGMLEPLGQSQVLAYLERLASGWRIHLISFEKAHDWADADRRERIAARIRAAGIVWQPRRYHKRFSVLATAYDIGIGTLSALWLRLRHRLPVLHARSDVATLMAWVVARTTGARLIFDMRGFWAEERVDGGLWPRDGRLYRTVRWFERRFLLSADCVISLTQAAVKLMQGDPSLQGRLPPIAVIPTCADLARFRPMRAQPPAGFVLGYVGSAGTWQLFDEVAACFTILCELRADARLLIVNRGEHDWIRARLSAADIPESRYELLAVEHADVPAQMARMSAGVFFNPTGVSRQAAAPTKLGEFLGCGVPCLSNAGYGDVADLLHAERTGVAIAGFDVAIVRAGLASLIALGEQPDIAARCAAAARRHFSLERGVAAYDAIYRELSATSAPDSGEIKP